MPVILFCEGGRKSRDIRILGRILEGILIKPANSRYGLDGRILFLRKEGRTSKAYALRDRDFDEDSSSPNNQPRPWKARVNRDEEEIGWSWERKEIENYLLDPVVMSKAFEARGKKPPNHDAYRRALEQARDNLAVYTAARTALSRSRKPFRPIENNWGEKTYGWPFPDNLSESSCRERIRQITKNYSGAPDPLPLDIFDDILPEFRPGGTRHTHFIHFFAGKDLHCAMGQQLKELGVSPISFLDDVCKGIEKARDDVWDWLPEWAQLRRDVFARR